MRCTQPNFTKGGGGGGGGGAPPRCPIPFLLCIISSRKGTRFGTHAIDKCYPFHIPSLELCIPLHWWIQGRSPGGPGPPYFSTKMRPEGPKKIFLETGPPLSQGVDDQSLPPYLKVWSRHCFELLYGKCTILKIQIISKPDCSHERFHDFFSQP